MASAYLGLGSNLGEKEKNILKAMRKIGERFPLLDYSSLYLTDPVGFEDQPKFLNMVLKIDAGETEPRELLNFVKSLEKVIGREKTYRWGPRIIDIDILYIDGIEMATEDLSIPHRELLKRNFVLIPLSEITGSLLIHNTDVNPREYIKSESRSFEKVIIYKSRSEIHVHG